MSFRLLYPGKIFVSYHSALFSDHFLMTVLVCWVQVYLRRFMLLPLDGGGLSPSTYLYLVWRALSEVVITHRRNACWLWGALPEGCGDVHRLGKKAFWRKAILWHLLLLWLLLFEYSDGSYSGKLGLKDKINEGTPPSQVIFFFSPQTFLRYLVVLPCFFCGF